MELTHLASPEQLREARRSLLEHGEVPPGLVNSTLSRSWLRSQNMTPATTNKDSTSGQAHRDLSERTGEPNSRNLG